MSNVHIVIPAYNHYELLHNLLWQLNRKEKENISSILIMDDCSPDEEIEGGLGWWESSHLFSKFSCKFQSVNAEFLRNANDGILSLVCKYSHDDIGILLSTDVLVYTKFISQIRDTLLETPKSLIGGVLHSHDTGWNKFGDRLFPYLEGWLLATTLGNWKELDYFDDRFAPCDYEDVDLSTTAAALGYQLVPLNNVGLVHKGGGSIGYSPKRLKQTNINKKKFEEKWTK